MQTLLAIRHVPFEDLGSFEEVLARAGYAIRYVDAPRADFTALARQVWGLLAVLGGPISVNDTRDYPFLEAELAFIEQRLRVDAPTLGICLGSQCLAKVLGARVYAGAQVEIGWQPLTLTDAGRGSVLTHLTAPVFHWHGETFDLPAGTRRLASTPACENQAFSYGRRVLALQFHPEVTAAGLEQWYVGHTGDLRARGLDPGGLRRAAERHASGMQGQAAAMLNAWLAELVPSSTGLDVDLRTQFDF